MNNLEKIAEAKKTLLKKDQQNEQGFVLVTVIVLLAILSIIGTVSLFKSNIEIKVSSGAVVSAQAAAAAEAGLAHTFAYWKWDDRAGETTSGITEQTNIIAAVSAGTATAGIYNEAFNGTAIPTDAVIQAAATVRIYNITNAGMVKVATNTWATTNVPQVAVWATRFNSQGAPAYPYNSSPAAGAGCSNCTVVAYALGRAGTPGRNDSRKMLREIQMSGTALLEGVSAMTNAPAYANWQDACDGAFNAVPAGGKDKKGNTPTPSTTPKNSTIDWVVEATQAEYALGTIPSGTAFASNSSAGPGGKSFRKGASSTTVATMDSDPVLVYSGHGTTTGMKADLMSTTLDTTAPNAPDLPAGKLPRRLVDQPLLGTSNVLEFFDPADPNMQLFNLDAYRWAAEALTCQNQGTASVAAAANTLDGQFCGKGEALRLAMGTTALAPVTGRLTLAEFEYNVAKGIPMFGMVRVMYPVYNQGLLGTCSNATPNRVYAYDTAKPTTGLYLSKATKDYTGDINKLDDDGNLGPKARLIVYGAILYDFFTDFDGDGEFDPAVSKSFGSDTFYEHLVNPFEAVDARMEFELLEAVNPALPDSATPGSFPTAAGGGGTIAVGSSSNPVNLAHPTAGWFPASEGMIPVSANQMEGQMNLMAIDGGAGGKAILNKLADKIDVAGGLTGAAKSYADTQFTNGKMHTRLDYYYQMMKATAKTSDPNSWPIAAFPADMSTNFCIGAEDCAAGSNDGDKVHLLFPSGYAHGWKVALAALDLKAADWNSILTGTAGLATAHALGNGGYGYNSGDGTYPKGSPFNMKVVSGTPIDPGSIRTAELTTDQNDYFKTDAGTGGYALLTSNWKDIPAQMYSGGIVDLHHSSNVSGVTYTSGPLEWESGNNSLKAPQVPTGYFNGSVITGFGVFSENSGKAFSVLVYDNQAVDNLSTNTTTIVMQRFAKEGL